MGTVVRSAFGTESMAGGARLALGQASGATACTDGGGGGGGSGGDVGLYEFELSLYALFTLLSEARLPPGRQRAFYALLGDRLLAAQLSSSPAAQPATGSAVSLKRVESGLEALLAGQALDGVNTVFAMLLTSAALVGGLLIANVVVPAHRAL